VDFKLSGAAEFRNSMRQQKLPYSIFAVKLPIDELVPELQKRFRIEDWQQNIDRTGTLADLVGVPIVKFKDSSWSIVYWSIGRYLNLRGTCRSMSWKFNCSSIALYETDNEGWVEWKVYQGTEEAETAIRTQDHYDDDETDCTYNSPEEIVYFESSLRKEPKDILGVKDKNILKAKLDDLMDELLLKEGICVPSLAMKLNDPNIDRVDLLVLPALPLGMNEFQAWIYESHPEYSIFAVKAEIESVARVIAKHTQKAEWKKDIQSESSIEKTIPRRSLPIFIIQPHGNQWTIVYWIVGDYRGASSNLCSKVALELNTLVISIEEEDTSGAIDYKLFDQGEIIEIAEWAPGNEMFFDFKKKDAEPEFDDFDDDEGHVFCQFINNRLIEAGVYIPSWDLRVSDPWIKRVDWLITQSTP
jgi:hypothetical protein